MHDIPRLHDLTLDTIVLSQVLLRSVLCGSLWWLNRWWTEYDKQIVGLHWSGHFQEGYRRAITCIEQGVQAGFSFIYILLFINNLLIFCVLDCRIFPWLAHWHQNTRRIALWGKLLGSLTLHETGKCMATNHVVWAKILKLNAKWRVCWFIRYTKFTVYYVMMLLFCLSSVQRIMDDYITCQKYTMMSKVQERSVCVLMISCVFFNVLKSLCGKAISF